MEEFEQLAISNDPLLACCLCRRLLKNATQLTCLHNCCRQCFNTAASNGKKNVACSSCGTVTNVGTEQLNSFIDFQVQRHTSATKSSVCAVCEENGQPGEQALVYCPTCRHSLCDECATMHSQYYRQHVARSLKETTSLEEIYPQSPASACLKHNRPLEVACVDCEQAKCISCCAECMKNKHKMTIVSDDSFGNFVGTFIASISAMENELVRKSEVLEQPKNVLRDTLVARDLHLRQINQRKLQIINAVELSYQEIELSTRSAYDDLEAEVNAAVATAERIASNLLDTRKYINRLVHSSIKCEILNQQKVVQQRLRVLSAELDTLSKNFTMNRKSVNFNPSLPDDVEKVVKAWIGMPIMQSVTGNRQPTELVRGMELEQSLFLNFRPAQQSGGGDQQPGRRQLKNRLRRSHNQSTAYLSPKSNQSTTFNYSHDYDPNDC